MLNYYKRNYPSGSRAPTRRRCPELPKVTVPVLMFHGLDDRALHRDGLSGTWNWVEKDLTLVTVPGAGHFVQQDAARARDVDDEVVADDARSLKGGQPGVGDGCRLPPGMDALPCDPGPFPGVSEHLAVAARHEPRVAAEHDDPLAPRVVGHGVAHPLWGRRRGVAAQPTATTPQPCHGDIPFVHRAVE